MLFYPITAADGSDYTGDSFNTTFTSGSMYGATRCVNITILEDGALEGDQTFTVMLTTSDPNVVIGINMTVVTIMDNDG
jgi:hypothetical protein